MMRRPTIVLASCALACAAPFASAQPDDPRVAQWESMRDEASDAFEEGDYAKAERLFRRMLGDCPSLGERSEWCESYSKHWIAYTLDQAGRNEEAVEMLRELAMRLRRAPDPDHHQLVSVLSGIATISKELGRYDDAIQAWSESCALWAEHRGDDDYDLAGMRMLLAEAQREAGRLEDAAKSVERALEIYLDHFDDDDDEDLLGVYQLAGMLAWESKRYNDAADCYSRIHRISKEASGPADRTTLSALEWRRNSVASAGRLDDALRDSEELHRIYAARYGDTHPEMFRHTLSTARFAISLGQWDAAEEWLARLENLVEVNTDFDNFDRRSALVERWRFHERRGERAKAEEALSRLRTVLD